MKHRLLFFLKYYLFWIVYFLILKILFLSVYYSKTFSLNFTEILGVFTHGFKLDLSTSTYIAASALLFTSLLSVFQNKILKYTMFAITIFSLVLCSLIAVGDLELYEYWGYRLDTTPLMYIDTPGEMMASVEWFVIVRQLLLFSVMVYISTLAYKKLVAVEIDKIEKIKLWHLPVFLILLGALIIPIRGGFKLAPLNTGSVYFSQKQFANHAANNVVWNLAFSFTYYGESTKNPFIFTDMQKAIDTRDSLFHALGSIRRVLKTDRPNIVLIILESFSNKMIEPLGGMQNVTPHLNAYCGEGICFNNFYGNGDRSDKGLVAIHSSFPSQAIASIIKFPAKTESLPFFTKDLKQAGYQCSYYYGGDINFAAMRSYIQNAGYDQIISDVDFPPSTYGAKWGVHDEFVFERLFKDIEHSKPRFLKTLFTLSSHEPFDVPYHSQFSGSSKEQKFLNSGRYTDSCLGVFIQKLKKSKYWDSTLVIITADHGTNHPNNSDFFESLRFKIPMIWMGGALNLSDTIVKRIGSQADISLTLLGQLNIKPTEKFSYSKDLLNNSTVSFAYYNFNNGFGLISDSNITIYNNASKKIIYTNGKTNSNGLFLGKSIQQVVYEEFLKK